MEIIDPLERGSFQTEIRNALELPAPQTSKLRLTFHPKQNYVVHYRNLKFFVHNGIKVTKIHQTVKIHQSKWLSKYSQLKTQKRQEASSKFDQDFYKLMSNSTFGKLCESLRNIVRVTFVRTEEELLKTTSDGNISSIKIIDEGLSLITKKKLSILWNKPTIVGTSILELSKLFMLNFDCNVMKKETQCQLLYSDTDSFVYKIKTSDFYHDLEVISTLRAHFDFSNFPRDHKLFDRSNEKQMLKFKDELAKTHIEETCALTPKLYSIVAGEQNKMSAKGTKKFAQLKLSHEMFKQTLQTGKLVRLENVKLTSERHQIQTVCVNKIALSAYEAKMYIMEDKKATLPFGHYSLTDEFVSKQICNETEWGIESNDSEETVSVFDLPEAGEASV